MKKVEMQKAFIPVIDIIGSFNFVIYENDFSYMVIQNKQNTFFVKKNGVIFFDDQYMFFLCYQDGFVHVKNLNTDKLLKCNINQLTYYTTLFGDFLKESFDVMVSKINPENFLKKVSVNSFKTKKFWSNKGFVLLKDIEKEKYVDTLLKEYMISIEKYYIDEYYKLTLNNAYYSFLKLLEIHKSDKLKVENNQKKSLYYVLIVSKNQLKIKFRKKIKMNIICVSFNSFVIKLNGKEQDLSYVPVILDLLFLISNDLDDKKVSLQFQYNWETHMR